MVQHFADVGDDTRLAVDTTIQAPEATARMVEGVTAAVRLALGSMGRVTTAATRV